MPYINPEAAVARESTEGTAPSTIDQQPGGLAQDVSLNEEFTKNAITGQAAGRNPTGHKTTNKMAEPSMPTLMQTPVMLEFFFGTLNEGVSGNASAPYDHEIREGELTETFTFNQLQKNKSGSGNDLLRQFRGCKVDSFTFESSGGGDDEAEMANLDLDLKVKEFDGPDQLAGTDADATSPLGITPFAHDDLTTVEFNGRTINHVNEVSIEGSNNLEGLPETGSIQSGSQTPNGRREVSASVGTVPDEVTNVEDAYSDTEGMLKVRYEKANGSYIEWRLYGAEIEEPGMDAPALDRAEDGLGFVVTRTEVDFGTQSQNPKITT